MRELFAMSVVACLAVVISGIIATAADGLVEYNKIDQMTRDSVRQIEIEKQGFTSIQFGE